MNVRRSVTRFLSDYRWYILTVAALAAFVLGCIGWWQLLTALYRPVRPGYTDAIYWSFNDFILNFPANRPGIPWELDVARFLAPAVAGWATLSALGALFRDRVLQMRIPLMRGHVVVCGLGRYVGSAFVRHLQYAGVRVVVVDSDITNDNIQLCRTLGVPVIIGDAQLQRTLQAAGVQRASRLLAVTPDDAVNTQIVAAARELQSRRSPSLVCMALLTEPELCGLLRIQEVQREDPELSVDFFNIDEISARLLLEHSPIDTRRAQPHILVAHLDPLGVWLVYHAARAWYENRGDNPEPLLVTVLDHHAEERVSAVLGQHPALEKVCKFISYSASVRDIHRLRTHHREVAAPPLNRAYVTAYHDEQALETALQLRHELDATIPVVVALSHTHGVAELLGDIKEAGVLLNLDVFSTMDRTCTVELVRGGSFEPMAHAIHERWRKEQITAGKPAPTWEDLDESRRESSRDQARDIPVKLRLVGCAIAPLRDWDAKDFTFTSKEIETLGVAEHERWNRERIADGWTLAAEKDVERKETPYLVPFGDLPPDIAEYDRIFVREIPAILASVGLQVIRTPTRFTPETSAPASPI